MGGCWPASIGRHGGNRGSGFSKRRRELLSGLRSALRALRTAGCHQLYIDGSFVTAKGEPGDYDACWDIGGVDVEVFGPGFSGLRERKKGAEAKVLR